MHVKIFSVLICIVLLNTNSAFAQGVGINNPTPDAILPLTAADEGLMIYNLSEHCINWWDSRPNSAGAPGFWNSQCQPCMDYFEYTTSSNGNKILIRRQARP